MNKMKLVSLVLLTLFWLRRPEAGAQASPVPLTPAARKLVDEGVAALSAGRPADALSRIEQAYRLSPAPELLQKLGQVAQAQGRMVQAADLYRRTLQEAGAELSPQAQQELRDFIMRPFDSAPQAPRFSDREAPQAPRFIDTTDEVAVFGEDGALVLLDGRVVGSLPLSLPLLVSAGSHKLRLEKGKRRVEAQVKLLANRPMQVRFTLVPPLAVATPTAAAVFLVDSGTVSEALVLRLLRAASQAAAEERILLLPRDKLAAILGASPELAGCIDSTQRAIPTLPCQEKLAARVEAQYVITLKIEAQLAGDEGKGAQKKGPEGLGRWAFSARLYDVRVGAEAAAGQKGCEGCGVERAALALGQVIGKMAQEGTTRPRGTLEVASTPPGAAVTVDGRQVGAAPAHADAFAGPHEVAVVLAGHAPYRTRATVTDGETTQVQAHLTKLATPLSVPPVAKPVAKITPQGAQPIYKKAWFWGTVGGVALLGAGLATGLGLGLNQTNPITAGKTYPFPFILSF